MMLASPLLPSQPIFSTSHVSDDSPLQYRPARDKEAFNSLLPPPIEFVEGSSSGALAVPPGKYEPINASPKASKPELPGTPKFSVTSPTKPTSASSSNAKNVTLHYGGVDPTWPETCSRGSGLYNNGNTCFLNSALQCLLHTPPLLRILIRHRKDSCQAKSFCMSCSMREVVVRAHTRDVAFSPGAIIGNLQAIAKHLRRGRQEDSHEFLRYAIDALQKSCLVGHPPKVDPKIAETTWVHKIFGGRLRSRVTCRDCGYNSDTFDRILDLSVDIHRAESLKSALKLFVAVDHLKGADKYKCEKCKKHVNADKQFTLHEAPLVLTVHLKRFSPLGRKIGHLVHYDDELPVHPYMSEGQYGPTYVLYGVICHAGGGPNSGHYYSFVRSKDGRWWEMNDEAVSPIYSPPHKKNAYMLFYIRKKGQGLEAAVNSSVPQPQSLIGSMKKRKEREEEEEEEEEDTGLKIPAPFIGPLLPSPVLDRDGPKTKDVKVNGADPQAMLIKNKIQVVTSTNGKTALRSLAAYASDESEDEDEMPEVQKSTKPPPSQATPQRPLLRSSPTHPPSSPVSATSFYSSSNSKKRKERDDDGDIGGLKNNMRKRGGHLQSRSSGYRGSALNPYAAMGKLGRPRGI